MVLKQNSARFYRISAFVIADAVVRIPLVLLDTAIFGTLTYWSAAACCWPYANAMAVAACCGAVL